MHAARLVPLLLVAGCAEAIVGGWIADSASERDALREQIRAKRYAAGLTPEQLDAEVRLLERSWWLREQRTAELRARGSERHATEGSSVVAPPWPDLWTDQQLYLRAEMLLAKKSEAEVVQRVADGDPRWLRRWRETVAEWPALALGVDPKAIRDPVKPGAPKARP